MDKTAMGHDFIAKVDKHGSQVDKHKYKNTITNTITNTKRIPKQINKLQ